MADELGVKVSAELDKAKSKINIDSGLKDIKPEPVEVEVKTKSKKLDTRSLEKDVENLKTKLSKSQISLDWSLFDKAFAAKDIKQATYELTVLKKTYRNLNAELSAKLPNQAIEALPKSINEANVSVATLVNNFKNLKSQGITVPDSSFANLENLTTKLNTFSTTLSKLDVSDPTAIKNALGEFRQITTGIDEMKNSYKVAVSQFRRDKIEIGAENIQIDLQKIKSNLVSMQREWSAAMNNPEFVQRFEEMFQIINSGTIKSGAQVTNFRKEVQRLSADIQAANLNHKTFLGQLAANIKKFSQWVFIGNGIMTAVRSVREMITAVKDLDSSLTNLKKVTDETNNSYTNFISNASKKAVELASSVSNLIDATTNFARFGYSLQDSYKLGQIATIYANVGDEVDGIDGATSNIISTMAGFRLSVSDATSIVDKFNNVGRFVADFKSGYIG